MDKLENENPLNAQEAAKYLNISVSHLYKLTSRGEIRHYKPGGKRIYFFQSDLNNFIKSNPVKSSNELNQEAAKKTIGVLK
ncbi:helix-turn-helix domain-containing protein [Rhodohalobacter sp.]|uniref:helix-turn-helix domain-containing protein n=1 Tax=Rhodohalobacter sp. TaxID=1974210 RepID=UPI002ACD5DC0|nr:helix-turn-helix domain-containing protein [Rhodohalobacter sp.]MDZ7757182.1 helix-turn-helix domain-containing protein [Rhodohalobacter sp.]